MARPRFPPAAAAAAATAMEHEEAYFVSKPTVDRAHTPAPAKASGIILLGAPGSGKGTISSWIKRDFGAAWLSTGDELRKLAMLATSPSPISRVDESIVGDDNDDRQVGFRVQELLSRGEFVPDEIVFRIVRRFLRHCNEHRQKFILDGFPRTEPQARALQQMLKGMHMGPTPVFLLDISEDVLIERMADRLIHPASGRLYSRQFSPPKVPMVDDETGEPLVVRSDDADVQTVQKRLEKFRLQNEKIVAYYRSVGMFTAIPLATSNEGYTKLKPKLDHLFSPDDETFSFN